MTENVHPAELYVSRQPKPAEHTGWVTTDQLKTGDVVRTHGCVFRLGEKFFHHLSCTYAFTTELLYADPEATLPAHWRETWIIQGNQSATWMRLPAGSWANG